jgi:NAD(P)-dependent dehydrogenase (short-subunit alcohol dehydrogenase family)
LNPRTQRHREKGQHLIRYSDRTQGTSELLKEAAAGKASGDSSCGVPLERARQIDEVAAAALFLGLKNSSFVHAAELFADGGIAQI